MKTHLAIALLMGVSSAAGAAGPKLGAVYTAELHGFSIRPPLGAERVKEPSSKRIVRWVRRDDNARTIRWSLEILKNRHSPNEMPAAEYAKLVAAALVKDEQFKVKSTDVSIVALRPAMHFRGVWSGALQLWRRQVWVRLGPEEHLVLDIAGRMAAKDDMDAALTASLATLRLFDPAPLIEQRRLGLRRGAAVLAGLTEDRLRALVVKDVHYFLVELEDTVVGFLKIAEGMSRRDGSRGLWVVRGGLLKLPGKPSQMFHEDLFATADRTVEQWRSVTVTRTDQASARVERDAIKQRGVLLVHVKSPGAPRKRRQLVLPQAIRPAYMPAAFSMLMPRLLDRSKPGAYGFAVFSPAAKDFHLRTVRVRKPEKIALGDKTVLAVRISDQMSPGAAATQIWVDAKGLLLRMETAQGLVTRRATRPQVVESFAKELIELDKLR